jgi:hypothetical protein
MAYRGPLTQLIDDEYAGFGGGRQERIPTYNPMIASQAIAANGGSFRGMAAAPRRRAATPASRGNGRLSEWRDNAAPRPLTGVFRDMPILNEQPAGSPRS